MKRHAFLRAQALWAIAAIVVLASCNQSPTAPSPSPAPAPAPAAPFRVVNVTPAAPIRSDTAQVLTVAGLGFRQGLALRITDPGGLSITIPNTDIRNLLPTSFQASVMLPEAGRYGVVVQQQNGEASGSFLFDVLNAPAATPQIDDITPSQTIVDSRPQQVSLIGLNFDESLTVHIVDPDGVLTRMDPLEFTIDAGSVIRFLMVFDKTGTYTFSLWNGSGLASNSGDVLVR